MLAKSQQHPHEKSRELQRRLYLAAKTESEPSVPRSPMTASFGPTCCGGPPEEVRANRGRPGADGVSIEDVERHGVEAYLA